MKKFENIIIIAILGTFSIACSDRYHDVLNSDKYVGKWKNDNCNAEITKVGIDYGLKLSQDGKEEVEFNNLFTYAADPSTGINLLTNGTFNIYFNSKNNTIYFDRSICKTELKKAS